jgi:hypothetical protein
MFFNNKVQSLLPALFSYYLCLISGAVDRWVLSLESRGAQWALSQGTELVLPTCTKGINMDELTFDPHVRAQHNTVLACVVQLIMDIRTVWLLAPSLPRRPHIILPLSGAVTGTIFRSSVFKSSDKDVIFLVYGSIPGM